MRHCFIPGLMLLAFPASATVITDTLYINSGVLTVADETLQTCVFNESSSFFIQNRIITLNSGDDLQLHVVNNDIVEHTLTIDGLLESGNVIAPGASGDFLLNFPADGLYRFYSDRPGGMLLGASSMILVGYENYNRYYLNFFEQEDTLTDQIDAGTQTSIPSGYMPDVFTINMKTADDVMMDTLSYITGNVSDTIYIAIINSGNMHHNLHFHGYHPEVVSAFKSSHMTGWSKDSFPVVRDEVMLLRLIPHQPGLYMVHNHNMITVTTNGIYPGGMMTMIDIAP